MGVHHSLLLTAGLEVGGGCATLATGRSVCVSTCAGVGVCMCGCGCGCGCVGVGVWVTSSHPVNVTSLLASPSLTVTCVGLVTDSHVCWSSH